MNSYSTGLLPVPQMKPSTFKKLAVAILVLGVALRLVELIFNRSLWCDEALLSMNFLEHDYAGLLKPLDNEQAAPILFLWIEKTALLVFGNHDYALRIFPFIVSLLTLWMFYRLCLKLFGKAWILLLLLFMFATSIFLLRYALEVKQYQGDMLVSLFFLLFVVGNKRFNKNSQLLLLLFTGSVAVWFSNVAVVMLCSTGLYILLVEYRAEKKIPIKWLPVMLCWVASFGAYFLLFIKGHPSEAFMMEFWQKQFPSSNIFSSAFVKWLASSYQLTASAMVPVAVKYNPAVYAFGALVALGILRLFKQSKHTLFILVFPIIVHLALAFAKKYPVADKFIIYLFPSIYLLFATGLLQLVTWFKVASKLVVPVVSFFVVAIVAADLYKQYPYQHEEIKGCIYTINKMANANQKVYVNKGAADALAFYKKTNVVQFAERVTIGNRYPEPEQYAADLEGMKNSEFWLLLSHIKGTVTSFMLEHISKTHTLKYSHKGHGSSCYLFSPKQSTQP